MTDCQWPNRCDCLACSRVYNHEIAEALTHAEWCDSIPCTCGNFVEASTLVTDEILRRVHAELDELIEAHKPVHLVVGSAALRAMADEALEEEMRRSLK